MDVAVFAWLLGKCLGVGTLIGGALLSIARKMGKSAWLVIAALAVVSIIIVLVRGLGQDFHKTVVANSAASHVYSNATAAPLQAPAPTTPALNKAATNSRLNDYQLERDRCCVGERCTWAGQLINPRAARIRTGAAPLRLNGFDC